MSLKDIEYFTRTIVNHLIGKIDSPPKDYFYWNGQPRPELDQLVNHLSNPFQPERIAIRTILRAKEITSLLDAACGPAAELDGYILEEIPVQYTGLDRSKYMLNVAKQKHPKHMFIQSDIHRLPFPNNSFHAVLLKHILEHVPNYKQPIREALRVTNRYVIINFFQATTPLPFDIPLWSHQGYWQNWYSKNKLYHYLHTLPIKNIELHTTQGNNQQTAHIYVIEKI